MIINPKDMCWLLAMVSLIVCSICIRKKYYGLAVYWAGLFVWKILEYVL